ncbi:MAG: hypothetical protein WCO57_05735 [Verrucomicrobiota bacterium]
MPLRPLRRIAALTILILPHVLSGQGTSTAPTGTNLEQSAASTQPVNTTPKDCCKCLDITINGTKVPAKAGHPSVPAKPEGNGNYTVNIEVKTTCAKVDVGNIWLRTKNGNAGEHYKIPVTGNVGTIPGDKLLKSNTTEWEVVIQCVGQITQECEVPISVGGCNSGCSSCNDSSAGGTGCPSVKNGSLTCDIPFGASNGGDTSGFLRFYTDEFNNPGIAAVGVFAPSSFTVNRNTEGQLTSVVGPVNTIVLATSGNENDFDPKAFTLTHKDTATNTAFRVTTVAMVQDEGTWLRIDSTFDSSTFRYQQSKTHTNESDTYVLQSGPVVNGSFTVMRVETRVVTIPQPGTEIHRETVQEEGVTVSDIETTWQNYAWGWERTSETIDPANANLTSTWSYYQPGEFTGPNSSTEGYGRLHAHARHDGYQETHTYWLNNHQVIKPFADNAQGLTLSEQWNPSSNTLTTVQTVGGNTLSRNTWKFTDSATAPAIVETAFASNGSSLVSTTVLMPFGVDFGGQTASIAHPDGTTSTHAYVLRVKLIA